MAPKLRSTCISYLGNLEFTDKVFDTFYRHDSFTIRLLVMFYFYKQKEKTHLKVNLIIYVFCIHVKLNSLKMCFVTVWKYSHLINALVQR